MGVYIFLFLSRCVCVCGWVFVYMRDLSIDTNRVLYRWCVCASIDIYKIAVLIYSLFLFYKCQSLFK